MDSRMVGLLLCWELGWGGPVLLDCFELFIKWCTVLVHCCCCGLVLFWVLLLLLCFLRFSYFYDCAFVFIILYNAANSLFHGVYCYESYYDYLHFSWSSEDIYNTLFFFYSVSPQSCAEDYIPVDIFKSVFGVNRRERCIRAIHFKCFSEEKHESTALCLAHPMQMCVQGTTDDKPRHESRHTSPKALQRMCV